MLQRTQAGLPHHLLVVVCLSCCLLLGDKGVVPLGSGAALEYFMSTVRNLSTEMDASGEWKQEGRNVDSFRVGAHTDSLHCCAKPQSIETHSWLFWRMEKSQWSNWGSFYYVQIPGWGQLHGSQILDLGAVEDAQVCTFFFFWKINSVFTNCLPKHRDEKQSCVVDAGQSHTHFYQATIISSHKIQRNSNVSLGNCVWILNADVCFCLNFPPTQLFTSERQSF